MLSDEEIEALALNLESELVERKQSMDTPVRFDGRVRIRVGPRRAVASRDEERILVEKRQSNDLPFDRKPVRGTTLNDVDLDFFRISYLPAAVSPDVLMENQRSPHDQLGAMHFLSPDGEPNTAAILLLGRDTRAWFPNAYIQFVRYEGADMLSAIVDQKVIAGRLPEMLLDAENTAKLHIQTATIIDGRLTEQRRPDYPLSALQQLLRNAVMHRSYEIHAPVHWYWFNNRIEIHSPGGLFGRVTPENFGKSGPSSTDYRNQIIAEGLKVTGFVQRFGMGIPLARQRCVENGNPPPEFEFSPSSVLAILKKRLNDQGKSL